MSLNSHFYFFWGNVVNLNKTCWSGFLTTWRKIDEDKISCQNKWLLKNNNVPNLKCFIICNGHRDVGEHITAEKLNTLYDIVSPSIIPVPCNTFIFTFANIIKIPFFFWNVISTFWTWHIKCLWKTFEFAYYMCMPCKFEWKKMRLFVLFIDFCPLL